MTHKQDALPTQREGPEASEQDTSQLYAVSAVYEEAELKRMREVLDAVCEKLNIKRDSADARAAAVAVLHQISQGHSELQALKDAVIASLTHLNKKMA